MGEIQLVDSGEIHKVLHLPSARNSWLGNKGALTAAGGHASAEDVNEWGLDMRQRYGDTSHQTSCDCLEWHFFLRNLKRFIQVRVLK